VDVSVLSAFGVLFGTTPEQLLPLVLMAARVLPLVVFVPVLGLRGAPLPFKAAIAFALAVAVAPTWLPTANPAGPLLGLLAHEIILGLPLAIGAAALLWAATMAGDLASDLYRDVGPMSFDAVPEARSSLGVLLSLLCAIGFLEVGAPVRLLRALAQAPQHALVLGSKQWWSQLIEQILGAIDLALAIAGPLLAVSFVTHIAAGLTARASVPLSFGPAMPALRSLVILFLFSLLFQALGLALFEQLELRLP
jgi:type III secretory pathway component EscT